MRAKLLKSKKNSKKNKREESLKIKRKEKSKSMVESTLLCESYCIFNEVIKTMTEV